VELQDPTHGARYREVFAELQRSLAQTPFSTSSPEAKSESLLDTSGSAASTPERGKDALSTPFKHIVDSVSKKIGSSLRGTETSPTTPDTAPKKGPKSVWDVLCGQDMFVSGVMDAQLSCGTKGKKDAKETHLRAVLSAEGYDKSSKRDPFPLPCAPEVMVNGVIPQTAKIFKSAVYPALVEFHVDSVTDKTDFGLAASRKGGKLAGSDSPTSRTSHHHPNTSYKVIVKTGDDLRQDQLVMMMIKLMDGLLKRASLDLCLTPYSIIATSPTSGLVEFVDGSIPVSQILATHNNSIMQFFQASAPQKGAKYDLRPDVMSTYIRSCAGYCVLTYILGVGDRHLDNILITKAGQFFHIDFGFMFGRDPKPLPPAFRLTREVSSHRILASCAVSFQHFNSNKFLRWLRAWVGWSPPNTANSVRWHAKRSTL
jgi:hypothetical protein